MVVFGIDPGYAIIGWGAVSFRANTYKALGFGAVETQAHTDFNQRLEIIYDEIYSVLERCRPDALSIEKLYFTTNKTTAIKVSGDNVYRTVANTVPYLQYNVAAGETPAAQSGAAAQAPVNGDAAKEITLIVPKNGDKNFFKVQRN